MKELNGLWGMELKALKAFISKAQMEPDDTDTDECENVEVTYVSGIAIIPVTSVLTKYPYPGCTSTLQLKNAIREADANPECSTIILWIDSPGGFIPGTDDCARAIAACQKPTVAVVSDMCCSAAYWLASQCGRVVANPSAFVGSIGVYEVLADTSKLYNDMGITMHLVKAGERKGIGADGIPISKEDLASEQAGVDAIYDLFVTTVANGREMAVADILKIATGEAYITSEALAMGLIDEVGDIQTTFQKELMKNTDIVNQIQASVETDAAIKADAATKILEVSKEMIENQTKILDTLKEETVAEVKTEIKAEDAKVETTDVEALIKNAKNDAYLEAQKDEKARFEAVLKACGNRVELAVAEWQAGHDVGLATAAYAAQLEKENKQLMNAAASVSSGTNPINVVGAVASTIDNPEAEWEANKDNCQQRFGKKSWYVAFRNDELKKVQG